MSLCMLQLVAPVRATGAQVLGVLLDYVEATKVQEIVKLLMVLSQQSSWEVRHAALLGIQHLLAVRQVLISVHLLFVSYSYYYRMMLVSFYRW